MPEITRFYGVIIKMYFQQADHNPPHIHAFCNGSFMGAIDIKTLKMLEGDLPPRALKMVQEWTRLHQEELLKIWNTQEFVSLPPLD